MNNEILLLRFKQERTRNVKSVPILDRGGNNIEISNTVEIINAYTNFSRDFPRIKQSRTLTIRGDLVIGYDIDKFRQITFLQKNSHSGRLINKVHFVTDSEFETWRVSKNLKKCAVII